ncbi:MAG: Smr/MutS family protein [Pseudomonadota bacterium]
MNSKDDEDDDLKLFREAVGPVRRIHSQRSQSRPARVQPRPAMREADEQQVLQDLSAADPALDAMFDSLETGEELLWLRPGLQTRLLKRLRRGYWRVQDEMDLHQMNVEAASRSIRVFLHESLNSGYSCVKIIHGKGLRSGPAGPRLKALTARLLSRHPSVLAFATAPHSDGGTGAVYVLLKNRAASATSPSQS